MSYEAKLRVWRGDDRGGELRDFTVTVNEGCLLYTSPSPRDS